MWRRFRRTLLVLLVLTPALLAAWAAQIPTQALRNLIHSMPERVSAVIEAQGGATRY